MDSNIYQVVRETHLTKLIKENADKLVVVIKSERTSPFYFELQQCLKKLADVDPLNLFIFVNLSKFESHEKHPSNCVFYTQLQPVATIRTPTAEKVDAVYKRVVTIIAEATEKQRKEIAQERPIVSSVATDVTKQITTTQPTTNQPTTNQPTTDIIQSVTVVAQSPIDTNPVHSEAIHAPPEPTVVITVTQRELLQIVYQQIIQGYLWLFKNQQINKNQMDILTMRLNALMQQLTKTVVDEPHVCASTEQEVPVPIPQKDGIEITDGKLNDEQIEECMKVLSGTN